MSNARSPGSPDTAELTPRRADAGETVAPSALNVVEGQHLRSPADRIASEMPAAKWERIQAHRQAIGRSVARRFTIDRKALAQPATERENSSAESQATIPEGGGQPLHAGVRKKLEPKLGADLGDVRVHTSGESEQAATHLGARAFTVGNDVHFGAGQFAPDSKEGDRLLAHELTHVIQGRRSGIQRKEADGGAKPDAGRQGDAEGAGGAADGHEVSQPGEPAEQEADAVADKVADELHAGGAAKDQGQDGGGGEHGHDTSAHTTGVHDGSSQASGSGGEKAVAAAPKPIAAKLDASVGRKVYLNRALPSRATPLGGKKIYRKPKPPAAPSAPAAARPASGATGGAAPSSAAAPPLTAATAKTALDSKARDVADLSASFATDWIGKTQADLDGATSNVNLLKHQIIEKFVSAGDERTQTQAVGRPDPIALQKFHDVDNEAHLSDPSLKGKFYKNLVAEMKKADFTDRTHTYPAMKNAAPPPVFAFKGNVIPANRISPLSARNHSVDKLFDNAERVIGADIDAEIERSMSVAGAKPAQINNAKEDRNKRRNAYRHILKKGRDPLTTIDKTKNISEYGTWYAPGEIRPNPVAAANTEFANMMTLGALQPEWYPNGTVVLNIDRRLSSAAREVKKPTCFDGMMSALWTARNLSKDDYGVTGGGVGEFLEAKVPFSDVTSATAIIPEDDFLADIQRVVSEVQGKEGDKTSPTEELVRGNHRNARILNTTGNGTGGAKDMYGQIIGRSTQEQNHPSAAPNASAAAQPSSGLMPAGPARAPGGAFDMTSGPRGRR